MAELKITLVNGELAGKSIQEINKQVRESQKELSKAKIGTEDFVKAQEKLDRAIGLQEDMKKQLQSTSKASAELKSQFGGILNQIPGFSKVSEAIGKARGGVGGLTSSFGGLRGAIIATGIGALVIAVTSLVSWFSKSDKGAKILSQSFKAMGAVIDTVMNRLWNIGDTLKQLFSNPIDFFKNLGNDIKNAAVEGWDLTKVFDELEDRQRELDVRAKEQDNQVERLLLQAKNASRTYSEKLALLEKADQLTRASYNEQLKLSDEYVKAVERELAAAEKTGVDPGEIEDKLRDAKLAYLNLVGEEIAMEEKIANRREQILAKKEVEAKKEVAIQKDKEDQIASVKEEAVVKETVKEEDRFRERLAKLDLQFETEQNVLNEQFLARQLTNEEFAKLSAQQLLQFHQAKLNLTKEQFGVESLEYQRQYKALLDLQIEAANESIATTEWLQTDGGKALMGSLATFGNAFSQIASMHEQGTKSWKAFATAAAVISAIQGSINAYTSTMAIPILGPALAPAAAAVALAAGMAQVSKIRATKVPAAVQKKDEKKMALGGYLSGPSHSQGGIPLEAEGGEFIFSKKAVRAIGVPVLDAINKRLTFETGGPVNPFSSPSFDRFNYERAHNTTKPLFGMFMSQAQAEKIQNARIGDLELFAEKVDKWASTLKVVNNVGDTEKGIKVLNQIKSEADV